MSLAPSIAVPRAALQSAAALYRPVLPALELCLRRRQDRRHRLPAADPAHGAIFAGGHPDPRHLGAARRGVAAHLARCRGVRGPRRRQQRALSRPRLYRAQDGVRRPRRPDRQRQSGIHGGAGRAVPRRGADLAQGARAVARHCRRRLHRLAPHVGRHRQPARHPVHAGVAGLDRGRHHPVQAAGAEGQPVDRQRRAESRRRHRAAAVRVHASPTSATSCRARGCWARSRSSCWADRSWPICSGFIC